MKAKRLRRRPPARRRTARPRSGRSRPAAPPAAAAAAVATSAGPARAVAQLRGVAAAVEGDDVGNAEDERPQHRQRRDQRVVALDVNQVPLLAPHLAPDSRREAPVAFARPGADGADADAVAGLLVAFFNLRARCRGPRPGATRGHPPAHFHHVSLHPALGQGAARGDHQYPRTAAVGARLGAPRCDLARLPRRDAQVADAGGEQSPRKIAAARLTPPASPRSAWPRSRRTPRGSVLRT